MDRVEVGRNVGCLIAVPRAVSPKFNKGNDRAGFQQKEGSFSFHC